MPSHSKTVIGSAVTSTSRAQTGTIEIPGGRGGNVVKIEVQVYPTLETIVNSGGLVELENDAVDWKPFKFYTGGRTCVTEGGAQLKPLVLKVKKPLPADSTITVYYTPTDNQSQKLAVTVHWEEGTPKEKPQTYMTTDKGSAITQTTVNDDHAKPKIPAGKGGKVNEIMVVVQATLETIVNSGGLVTFENQSAKPTWGPLEFYTNGVTVVAAGGADIDPHRFDELDLDGPGNSTILVDYTPQDNQSQFLQVTVVWEG